MRTLKELEEGLNSYVTALGLGYVPKSKDHRLHELPKKYGWLIELFTRGLDSLRADIKVADRCVRCGQSSEVFLGREVGGKWTCQACLHVKRRRKTTPAK